MIKKLFKLKEQQINQQLMLKQEIVSKINELDIDLQKTHHAYHNTTIDVIGAISDFRVLEIHKATMKEHIIKLLQKKEYLTKQLTIYDDAIIVLNKESEQFKYIMTEEAKLKIKAVNKQEELVASEYMQAKFIQQQRGRSA